MTYDIDTAQYTRLPFPDTFIREYSGALFASPNGRYLVDCNNRCLLRELQSGRIISELKGAAGGTILWKANSEAVIVVMNNQLVEFDAYSGQQQNQRNIPFGWGVIFREIQPPE